jgi:hypothetical protein
MHKFVQPVIGSMLVPLGQRTDDFNTLVRLCDTDSAISRGLGTTDQRGYPQHDPTSWAWLDHRSCMRCGRGVLDGVVAPD